MKIKRRIQIITIISLLLASGVGSMLSGRPIDAFAAELETVSAGDAEVSSLLDIMVPIYDYDVLNVLVPTSYAVAFNPYGLNVRVGESEFISRQVIVTCN